MIDPRDSARAAVLTSVIITARPEPTMLAFRSSPAIFEVIDGYSTPLDLNASCFVYRVRDESIIAIRPRSALRSCRDSHMRHRG